jgi:hypothetical protein
MSQGVVSARISCNIEPDTRFLADLCDLVALAMSQISTGRIDGGIRLDIRRESFVLM